MKFFVFVALTSLLAFSQCGVITQPQESEIAPYSIIDPIIKAILESLKPKLADLKLGNINETIRERDLNASILVKNINIKNADKFVIRTLTSKVIPLQLTNLTLTWADISAAALYDIDANVSLSNTSAPLRLSAKGDASACLKDIFFTIGANVELKNNALQIKPRGLFGFNLIVKKANIVLSSILGSTDIGKTVSVFLSQIIPQLIDTLKKPIFDTFQDDIIKFVNEILKNNGTTYMPHLEYEETPKIDPLDLTQDLGSFLESSEENDSLFNF